MIDRVLKITSPIFLQKDYGRLIVKRDREIIDTIPIDNISAVLLHPVAATISAAILAEFATRNIPVILIGADYLPIGELVPYSAHYLSAKRLEAQLSLPAPARKQAWQQIITTKIQMQAAAAHLLGQDSSAHALGLLAKNVRSGDRGNVEAQAAKVYFKAIFGDAFVRDRTAPGINSMLNYGYTLIRAACARQLAASGLNMGIALFHHNMFNPFRLADDLMEPYRPYVDLRVAGLLSSGQVEVDPSVKRSLVALLKLDIPTGKGNSPLGIAIGHAANTLANYYGDTSTKLELPTAQNSNLAEAYSVSA